MYIKASFVWGFWLFKRNTVLLHVGIIANAGNLPAYFQPGRTPGNSKAIVLEPGGDIDGGGGSAKQRACGLIGIARSTLWYELRQPAKDAPGDCSHETALGAVSALRLPPHPDLPAPRRNGNECITG